MTNSKNESYTIVCLIAEQGLLREQDGITTEKRLSEQDLIREQDEIF